MRKFALAGNPNCGKTTLFNVLTGSTAYVGNWPGVTVEQREGTYKGSEEKIQIVDLPGIYSLSPYTPEEIVSRNYILDEKPDCIINIIDATNLERNLYLTTQLMEIDVPIILALNMMDAVEKSGDKINAKELEEKIGLPVVTISALHGAGIKELMDRAISISKQPRKGETVLNGSPIAHLIRDVSIALKAQKVANPLFHAVKLSELDELEVQMHPQLVELVDEFKATFSDDTFGTDFDAVIADARYQYITANYTSALIRRHQAGALTKSDKADRALTHKIWGIPIFLVILFSIFHLTFSENLFFLNGFGEGWMPTLSELGWEEESFWTKLVGCFYNGTVYSPGCMLHNLWNEIIVGYSLGSLQTVVAESGMASWAVGFLGDGILEGLMAVLSFLPQILTLFLFFSILEDSGYMARVAFILDKIFRKFGLSGRAFMPMIMGFGCSIPATINTRTLSDDNERTATIRVIPFFSCGAKLPILTAIAGAIAAQTVGSADLITYGMYLLGIVTAILCVLLMRSTTMRGDAPPFIMELPAYHAPLFKSLMLHLWDKTKHFIKKAFTVILASTILIWVLSHFSPTLQFLEDYQINQSLLANLGKVLQPVLTPLGFGAWLGEYGWVFAVSALTGLIAKENVISTFATLAVCIGGAVLTEDETGISYVQAMMAATGVTSAGLIAFIAFNMTTIPCFAACATARAELPKGKFKWTVAFWLAVSYVVSMTVYFVGTWWWTCFIFLAIFVVMGVGIALWNKKHPVKGGKSGHRVGE